MKYSVARTDMDLLFLSVLDSRPAGAREIATILDRDHNVLYNPGSVHNVMVRLLEKKFVTMRVVNQPRTPRPTHQFRINVAGKRYLRVLRNQYLEMHRVMIKLGLPDTEQTAINPQSSPTALDKPHGELMTEPRTVLERMAKKQPRIQTKIQPRNTHDQIDT
jgi:DNA-binding PadR family transcriptional regulator